MYTSAAVSHLTAQLAAITLSEQLPTASPTSTDLACLKELGIIDDHLVVTPQYQNAFNPLLTHECLEKASLFFIQVQALIQSIQTRISFTGAPELNGVELCKLLGPTFILQQLGSNVRYSQETIDRLKMRCEGMPQTLSLRFLIGAYSQEDRARLITALYEQVSQERETVSVFHKDEVGAHFSGFGCIIQNVKLDCLFYTDLTHFTCTQDAVTLLFLPIPFPSVYHFLGLQWAVDTLFDLVRVPQEVRIPRPELLLHLTQKGALALQPVIPDEYVSEEMLLRLLKRPAFKMQAVLIV